MPKKFDCNSILAYSRDIFDEKHDNFRAQVRAWITENITPHVDKYNQQGYCDKEVYYKAARAGYYCSLCIPKEFGGLGLDDYRYNTIVNEELDHCGAAAVAFGLGTDIVVPYFLKSCTEEQKQRWLPQIARGEKIIAIAMSEPGTGSDLQGVQTTAVSDGDHYVINGNKMWITNGYVADLVLVVCYTDKGKGYQGISIIIVEKGTPGFSVTKILRKIGGHGNDTTSLKFDNVRVPKSNIVGEEGMGFLYLMSNLPQERMNIAASCMASARRILATTVNYCHFRRAFNKKIGNFQHVAFRLAELKTEVQVGTTFVDKCLMQLVDDDLSTETASMAKCYITDLVNKVADECLQFFGGYGFLEMNPVAQAYVGARVTKIFGGTNEIMKEIITRHMGFAPSKL